MFANVGHHWPPTAGGRPPPVALYWPPTASRPLRSVRSRRGAGRKLASGSMLGWGGADSDSPNLDSSKFELAAPIVVEVCALSDHFRATLLHDGEASNLESTTPVDSELCWEGKRYSTLPRHTQRRPSRGGAPPSRAKPCPMFRKLGRSEPNVGYI